MSEAILSPLTDKELEKLNKQLAEEGQTAVNTENFSIGGEHIGYAQNQNNEA